MSKKHVKNAARDGRVAVLPGFLQEGREVWYWRELLCQDDLCPDCVSSVCPLNAGYRFTDPETVKCCRDHPVLDKMEVWSVAAQFTPSGVEWIINDLPGVDDRALRAVYFPSRAEAIRHRPGRIEHG